MPEAFDVLFGGKPARALFGGSLAFGGSLGGSGLGLLGGSLRSGLLLGQGGGTLLLDLRLGGQTGLLGRLGIAFIHLLNLASASDSEKAPLATPPSRCFL